MLSSVFGLSLISITALTVSCIKLIPSCDASLLGPRRPPRAIVYLENQKDYDQDLFGVTFLSSLRSKVCLKCYAEFPVQWVFDNQPEANDRARSPEITTLREFGDYSLPSTYYYRSHMVFWYDSEVRTQIFSCEAVDNPCIRRLFLSKPVENGTMTQVRYIEDLNIPELDTEQVDPPTRVLNHSNGTREPCPAHFYYGKVDSNWAFCCRPESPPYSVGEIAEYGQVDATSLENFERNQAVEPSSCATSVSNFTDVCPNITELTTRKSYALKCNRDEDETSIGLLKVIFPISRELYNSSVLYWNWNEIKPESMMRMDLPDPVSEFENNLFTLTCLISLTYFSHGGFVAVKDSENGLIIHKEVVNIEVVNHTYVEQYNAYLVQQTIPMPKTTEALYCIAPVWNSSEFVNTSVSVLILEPEPLQIANIRMGEKVTWELGEANKTLSCRSTGKPITSIVWEFKNKIIAQKELQTSDAEEDLVVVIPEVNKTTEGTYICRVSNYKMTTEASIDVSVYDFKSFITTLSLSIVAAVVGLSLLAGMLFLLRKNAEQRRALRLLTKSEINDFTHGSPVSEDDPQSVLQRPYNPQYELSKNYLIFHDPDILGKGAFGTVYKGDMKISTKPLVYIDVAVKTVPKDVDVIFLKSLLSELKILSFITSDGHPNVIKLMGACTKNLHNREVYVAIEYCSEGNLKEFLERKNEMLCKKFKSVDLSQTMDVPEVSELIKQLTDFARKISEGMQFLASKNVVHGDIAARNILLNEIFEPKIADFGLARILAEPVYIKSLGSQCPLPWRGMAIESFESRKFSVKSDVWAYGILLWEIFSLGQTPYAGVECNPHFLESLKQGMRCLKPPLSSARMYDLMYSCWKEEPAQRSSFQDISRQLEHILVCLNTEETECRPDYVRYHHVQQDYVGLDPIVS